MTNDDLQHMQDGFFDRAQKILRADTRFRPVGFIVTLHKHLDKLADSGWGVEFLDFKARLCDDDDDTVAVLILDLAMDWKRLYTALVNVYPPAKEVLPKLLRMGETLHVDDPHMRVVRPFMQHAQIDEKDVIAAIMEQICHRIDAFASILQTEAWMRIVEAGETEDEIRKNAPNSLGQDQKSVEVLWSSMETYNGARMLAVPVQREIGSGNRDDGKVLGFGKTIERRAAADDPGRSGRFTGFLKPLPEAS